MTPRATQVQVKIADLPAFKAFLERVEEFVSEYAWHTRDCASIDADGEWRFDSPPCSCGYDQALAAMTEAKP